MPVDMLRMEVVVKNGPKYHILLVGIDAYNVKPLRGCVNDIDAVQRLLLERADIPGEDIARLASPHAAAKHETRIAQKPATLANIRAALARLASDEVQSTDRVFIYYSGHGARASVAGPQGTFHCESLVPVDFNATPSRLQLLPDFELNPLLAAIAKRTPSVAVVLDCCHSTGATRERPGGPEATARFLDFAKDFSNRTPLRIAPGLARTIRGEWGVGRVDDCQVVAACLNHELAQEVLGDDGVNHGLLTRAFVKRLSEVPASEIRSVLWARIWQKMRDDVETANQSQHLWMSGSYARPVLAGPPVEGDTGFAVKRTGPNDYAIDAGTLADVEEGARLAVYGDRPALFPALGSREDEQSRVSKSLLKVVHAGRAIALARCESAPFELPPGARARLVELGLATRLPCGVVPEDAGVVAALKASDLLQVVGERDAQARLERRTDGTWAVADDVSGAKPNYPALIALRPDQLDMARQVFELYSRYSLPLRLATRCTDLSGQLQVRLLACPPSGLHVGDAQKADLPELIQRTDIAYALAIGTSFCVHVRNASTHKLRVAVVNCAASGRVEFLGDQALDPRSYYRFWLNNTQGAPFVASQIPGKQSYLDRIVVIGTTLLDKDLRYLSSDTRFSDILVRMRTSEDLTRDVKEANSSRPVEKWTATQVILTVGIPEESL